MGVCLTKQHHTSTVRQLVVMRKRNVAKQPFFGNHKSMHVNLSSSLIRIILVPRAHVVLTKRHVGSGNEIVSRILQVIVARCLSKIAGFLRY